MKVENIVFLGVGSNLNKEKNIKSCIKYLQASFKYCVVSPVYQSPSFGFKGNDFYNLAVKIKTHFSLFALKKWLLMVEDIHARDRSQPRYSNRTLDIDILLYNDDIYRSDSINIPRPEILTRAYVLKPLTDISANMKHPQFNKTLIDLWNELNYNEIPKITLINL